MNTLKPLVTLTTIIALCFLSGQIVSAQIMQTLSLKDTVQIEERSNLVQYLLFQIGNEKEPFQDAVFLNQLIESNDVKGVIEVLKKYRSIENETVAGLQRAFAQEPLLIGPINQLNESLGVIFNNKSVTQNTFNDLTQAVGSVFGGILSPSVLLDNMGQLIANRFQEELNIAYIERLRTELDKPQFKDVKALLPNAFSTLINNDPIDYKTFLPTLRAAFAQDFTTLPNHIPDVILNNRDQFEDAKSLFVGALSSFHLLNNLENAPADIIEDLAFQEYLNELPAFNEVIQLLNIFSQNLRGVNSLSGWRSLEDLEALNEGRTFQLFIGLVLLKEHLTVSQLQSDIKSKLLPNSRPLRRVFSLFTLMGEVQQQADSLSKIKIDGTGFSPIRYNAYVQSLLEVFQQSIELGNILELFTDQPAIDQILTLSEDILSISAQIANQEFEQIVVESVDALQTLFPPNGGNNFLRQFSRYANFAVDLINADSNNLALTVIETAALPVRSYRTKRQFPLDLSLNAYPGLFGALESFRGSDFDQLQNQTTEDLQNPSLTFGFTAPIGLALSFGSNKSTLDETVQRGTFSIFAPLIDIGALTSFRIQDQTSLLPELSFSNVFAPGLYGIYGFKESPISIGAGLQYGPEIREVTLDDQTIDAKAWRFGIFLGVDIPVIRIFTKAPKN